MLSLAAPAFAQAPAGGAGVDLSGTITNPSDLYPVRVDVIKIYAHAQGYRVVYRKGTAGFAEAFIPAAWFTAGGKGMLIRARGPEYPYMVVYYRSDGTFSHVKLYVQSNMSDSSWASLVGDPGDRFKVDTLKLEF